jgi:hypothetical protein
MSKFFEKSRNVKIKRDICEVRCSGDFMKDGCHVSYMYLGVCVCVRVCVCVMEED